MAAQVVEDVKAYQLEPGISTTDYNSHYQLTPRESDEHEPTGRLLISQLATDQQPNSRPDVIKFAAIRDPKLRVVQAIPLRVSVEDEHVIVCWSDTDEFGTGDTLSEALDDFANGLRDLYHQLFAPGISLGVDLQKVKTVIEKHIQPR